LIADPLAAEFDMLMARAGLMIPADRRDSLLAGFADLRGATERLRQPCEPSAEPSNVFRLAPLA